MHLDLASLKSVRNFAETFLKSEPRLDLLINNAGNYLFNMHQKTSICKEGFSCTVNWYQLLFLGLIACGKTEDGFGMAFGVNHLGHFLLTLLLLDRLKEAEHSRIVNVSALLHRLGSVDFNLLNAQKDLVTGQSYWHAIRAYCHSKLCNVLFTRELANCLEGTNVTCYCLHPGQWRLRYCLAHKLRS